MAGLFLNFFSVLSVIGVFFFAILTVMTWFKSEALGINEDNRINNVIKLSVTAGVKYKL